MARGQNRLLSISVGDLTDGWGYGREGIERLGMKSSRGHEA